MLYQLNHQGSSVGLLLFLSLTKTCGLDPECQYIVIPRNQLDQMVNGLGVKKMHMVCVVQLLDPLLMASYCSSSLGGL